MSKLNQLSRLTLSIFILIFTFSSVYTQKSKQLTGTPLKSKLNENWIAGGLFSDYKPEQEILESRTDITKKFKKENGSLEIILGGPFHYLDNTGTYQDIDLEIIKNSSKSNSHYINTTNHFKSFFNRNPKKAGRIVHKGFELGFGMNTIISGNTKSAAKENGIIINKNKISYKNVFPDSEVEYEILTDKLLHKLIINSIENLNIVGNEFIEYNFELNLPTNTQLYDDHGILENGKTTNGYLYIIHEYDTIYTIFPGRAWDAHYKGSFDECFNHELPEFVIPYQYKITYLNGNKINICSKIPVQWLLSEKRKFPIVIDPTINIGNAASFSSNYRYPFNTCRLQRISQILFRKSDLIAAGFNSIGTITKVDFFANTNNPMVNNNVTLSFKEVAYTAFTIPTLEVGGFTQCFFASQLGFVVGAPIWKELTLNTPFNYTNSQVGLLLEVKFNNCGLTATSCPNQNTDNGGHSPGGQWGFLNAPYNGHRWAYSSSCTIPPSPIVTGGGIEDNPSFGNFIPATRITIEPPCSPPNNPSTNNASNISSNSFQANWNFTANTTNYILDVSLNSNFTNLVISNLSVGNVNSYSVTGLNCNTIYYYRLKANNICGTSGYSNTITLTTLNSQPSIPTAVAASGVTTSSFIANWNFANGANNYFLDVSTTFNFANYIYQNVSVGNTTSYFVSGLNCNSIYYYRVRAANSCNTTTNSVTISIMTANCCAMPNPPAINAASNITSTSFTANWNSSVGANNYYIDVSLNVNFTNIIIQNLSVGNNTFYNVQGLSPNTLYYYRIRAAQGACVGLNSAVANTTTNGIMGTIPNISGINTSPSNNIKATQNSFIQFTPVYTSNSAILEWEWRITGGGLGSPIIRTEETPSVFFFSPGAYKITVRARNSTGWSSLFTTPNNFITVCGSNEIQAKPTKEINNINAGTVADPINLATGVYQYSHNDFNIRSVNSLLSFTRFYNSAMASVNGPLGFGWSHSYNYSVKNQDDSLWVVHYGNGTNVYFVPLFNGNGKSFPLHGGIYDNLEKDQITGKFKLIFKAGDVYHFNLDGTLSTITDLNGNQFSFIYQGANLSTIIAPGGRSINLSYVGDHIVSIQDPLGRIVSFNYDIDNNLVKAIDANNGHTNFLYSNLHLLTTIILPKGNTLLGNTYDGQGRAISQTDGLGNITLIEYDTPGLNQATVTNPDNSKIEVHHDSLFRKIKTIDELGFQMLYTYDFNNNLILQTNENGNTTNYIYDDKGNLLITKDAENNMTINTYNSANRLLTQKDPLNNITSYVYDPNQNLIQANLPNGATRMNTFFSNGLQKSASDALGNITNFNYNGFGDLISVISPAGTRTYNYDAAGRLISETDENNNITTYTLNNHDFKLTSEDALNNSIINTYDLNDNLVSVKDKNGNITQFNFDLKDRLISSQDAAGGITSNIYDSRDNIIKITNAIGNSILSGYDFRKRLISRTNSLGTNTLGYDPAGNLISETDPYGNSKKYKYDGLNRQISKKDELGNETKFSYDAIGRVVENIDPLGNATQYSYNTIGLLIKVIDANANHTEVSYDENGNRTSIKDANGHIQNFTYDASSRLISTADAEGNNFQFIYDGIGNLILEVKPTGTITRKYDALNRLTDVILSDGGNYKYFYDNNGNLLSLTNNLGTSSFNYDNLNRRINYHDLFNNIVSYDYDAVGNTTKIIYPGNLIVNYNYNSSNLMTTVTDWLGHIFTYSYDSKGQLKGVFYPNGTKCLYDYDIAGRLIKLENSSSDSVINRSIFILDAIGQRVEEERLGPIPYHLKESSFKYSYGMDDRLLSDSITQYINDNSGNRLSELNQAGNTNYNYSVDNLLNSYSNNANQFIYRYDALGNRVIRLNGQNKSRYVLNLTGNISQVLQETDTNGIVKVHYIYGLGLLARIDSSFKSLYYHYDAQHNTIALTNSSSFATDSYINDPFGELLVHEGTSDQPFIFLGKFGVQTENFSVCYIRRRYYDSRHGKFLGKDPLPGLVSNPLSLNKFTYSLNNPMMRYDPSGLISFGQLGVGALQLFAGAGKVASGTLGVIGAKSALLIPIVGPTVSASLLLNAGEDFNESSKYLQASGSNFSEFYNSNDNWNWKDHEEYNGPLESIYDNPTVSKVNDIATIISGIYSVSSLLKSSSNIQNASKHLNNLPKYSRIAIINSYINSIKNIDDIYKGGNSLLELLNDLNNANVIIQNKNYKNYSK